MLIELRILIISKLTPSTPVSAVNMLENKWPPNIGIAVYKHIDAAALCSQKT